MQSRSDLVHFNGQAHDLPHSSSVEVAVGRSLFPVNMPQPITIVSGLPRSGTSMMMRMIVAAGIPALTDHARQPDEDNPLGYFEYEAVKSTRADPSWLNHAPGKVVKLVHILLPDLPVDRPYRIIMMYRDMDEVIASQQKMLARHARLGAHLSPASLRAVYAAQLETVRRWMESHPACQVLDVHYRGVLTTALAEAERIAAFLNVPHAAPDMAAAVDSSLYRNRCA